MQSISTSAVQDCTVKILMYCANFYYVGHCFFFAFSLICCLKFRCWSRNHPRYLTALLTAIGSPWASSGSGDVFLSCCWELKRMYSIGV